MAFPFSKAGLSLSDRESNQVNHAIPGFEKSIYKNENDSWQE
jgi:hypothetical protein